MTLHQALVKARKRYPNLRLGQLIYEAVVLRHPELEAEQVSSAHRKLEQKAKIADIVYSLTDDEMERILSEMVRAPGPRS
ncbi:MAG: hypothetical protein OK455_08355 [Thaumarchaeota archaeon]|nr:hypothetical protein [Nitrososphaerota archaeon]